jgi:proteic killer suppression protein
MAIQSYKCRDTEALVRDGRNRRFASIAAVALRKLDYLNAAAALSDLRAPPGHRLEALTGNRVGQHSIRVNDQWRLCFAWTDVGPVDVEICD